MKKLVVFTVLLCCGTAGFYCTGDDNNLSSTHAVKELYSENLDSFMTAVMKFQQTANERPGQDALQDAFKAARKAYKKVELFAEYYNPATAKAINGPALDEVEADNPEYPEPPHGFQVIEELLFPEYDTAAYAALRSELAALKSVTTRLSMVNETLAFTDSHIFDAVRLELFRIETLALAGFDTPVSFISIEELPVTLQALQTYLTVYKNSGSTKAFDQLSTCFNKASAFLQSNNDFNTFDRALFLVQYMNPLTRQLNIYQEAAGVAYFKEPRPLAPNASTLFDKNLFNPFAR